MSAFAGSAAFYDALYADKDYAGEAKYVAELIHNCVPQARSLADFGCGTARHALKFAELGFGVTGIDRSGAMLERAKEHLSGAIPEVRNKIVFREGDIRNVSLERRYDAAVALFHVMSYQASNEDLSAAFSTAAAHLDHGGVFIFDFWYGPGVLRDLPVTRVKRLSNGSRKIIRIAEPVLNANANLVDVNYHFIISEDGRYEEFSETHRMRYLFVPEVEMLLRGNNLIPLFCYEWMKWEPPGSQSWNAVFAARKS
jgi:SAM-dependent methyltransferase